MAECIQKAKLPVKHLMKRKKQQQQKKKQVLFINRIQNIKKPVSISLSINHLQTPHYVSMMPYLYTNICCVAMLCSIVNCRLIQIHINIQTINRELRDDTWTRTHSCTQLTNPLPSVLCEILYHGYILLLLQYKTSHSDIFFNHNHPSPPLLPVAQHSVLSALCGGLACVNMTDWASVGPLIASFHGCESVLWSGRVNKLWIQAQGESKKKEGERASDGMKSGWRDEHKRWQNGEKKKCFRNNWGRYEMKRCEIWDSGGVRIAKKKSRS